MARLLGVAQIKTSEGRQSDEEIDFRFGECPAVRDCGANARGKRERLAGGMGAVHETEISVIADDFHLGLFCEHGCSFART
jgi:hypothetical protein